MPDNALVESFNGRLRDECLNANWFLSLADARSKIETWRRQYNESRPHTWGNRGSVPLGAGVSRPTMEEVVVPRQDEVAGSRLDAGPIHRAENNHG